MATHSSTHAWKIPWMKERGRLQSMGCKGSDMTEQLHFLSPFKSITFILNFISIIILPRIIIIRSWRLEMAALNSCSFPLCPTASTRL